MTPDELARGCAALMWASDRASQGLGIRLEHIGPGEARLSMEVAEVMTNGFGACHGGFLFALADSAFAYACNTANQRAVASHCSVTYLHPGQLGDRLTAIAARRTEAGRSGLYDVSITNQHGIVIAEFRGHSRTIGSKFFEDQP